MRFLIMLRKEELSVLLKSKEYHQFKRSFLRELHKAIDGRYRLLLILAGDDNKKQSVILSDILINFLKRFLQVKNFARVLYVYHDEFSDAKTRVKIVKNIMRKYIKKKKINAEVEFGIYETSDRYLGTTYQGLIMDLVNSLRPLDVGRLGGIVEGGGIVILLTPKWSEWHNRKNLFQMTLAVPQHPEPRNVFVRWFKEVTMSCDGIFIYDVDRDEIIKMASIMRQTIERRSISFPSAVNFPIELYHLALTQDQVEAIRLIESLIELPQKPYKRTAVILIADRGRGKSCAIGIALAGLIKSLLEFKNKLRIAITAPSLNNVQSLMQLAIKALNALQLKYKELKKGDMIYEIKGDRFSIEYWEPAVVPKLDVDIAVVDEAAGIPVPLLYKILLRFRRTIFATTIHGYEGAGRGFSVRFLKRIKEDKETNLIIYEMEEPIRYSSGDPVERWQFRVLLLDAEPEELSEEDLKFIEAKEFRYLRVEPEEIYKLENEKVLRALFGIYVLAHYRNEPDDLAMMADAPHHSIRALALKNGKIVAAAQLAEEGPIPPEYLQSLLRGGKIAGNIIPDRLLKHGRLNEIGFGRGWRIVRIAVHPSVQGKGVGSYLLQELIKEAIERGYDWIGSGFGATEELLRFWVKNGFTPLHISPDRNPVSAEYTVLVLKPLNDTWNSIVNILYREFLTKLLESLHDTYRDLEVDVAWQLLKAYNIQSDVCAKPTLTPIQLDRLLTYIEGHMTYESCCDAIAIMVKNYWRDNNSRCKILTPIEEKLTITKVLQGLSWEMCSSIFGKRKNVLIDEMREIIAKLLKNYFSIDKNDIDTLIGHVSMESYKHHNSGR
jgi:tRNA(Met) cytidine acetyltransferase